MKKALILLLKISVAIAAVLIIGVLTLKLIYTEDIPLGESGDKADELAIKMLEAINYEAFEKADYLEWTFRGVNHYEWYPQENRVIVSWNDKQVELDTRNPSSSKARQDSQALTGEKFDDAVAYALENFNNDSFWVVAPYKVMDPGTEREIVTENDEEKILVRYTSGGTTPGDVYVWELDENYRPVSFKMWVDILPLDGLQADWNEWYKTEDGYYLSKKKTILGAEIPMSAVNVSL